LRVKLSFGFGLKTFTTKSTILLFYYILILYKLTIGFAVFSNIYNFVY